MSSVTAASSLLLDVPELEQERVGAADQGVAPGDRGEELAGIGVGEEFVVALLNRLGDLLLLVERAGGEELRAQLLDRLVARPAEPVLPVAGGDERKAGDRAGHRVAALPGGEDVPAALRRRVLLGPPRRQRAPIHRLEIDIDSGLAELVGD